MNSGFSLIEVMISLAIFSLVIAGMGPAFASQIQRNTAADIRSEAISLGEQTLDALRFLDPVSLPSTGQASSNSTVGSRVYTVTTYYCLNTTYCSSNNNRHVTVRVFHKNIKVFDTETVFTQLD